MNITASTQAMPAKILFGNDQKDDDAKPSASLDDVKKQDAPTDETTAAKKSEAKKNGPPDYTLDDLKKAGFIVGGATLASMIVGGVGGFLKAKLGKKGGDDKK